MSTSPPPPRWAARVIGRLVTPASRTSVLGDLEERFAHRATRHGRARAQRWYLRQTLQFLRRVPVHGARKLAGGLHRRTGRAAEGVLRDLRFGARNLRRRPGFALPVAAIFALAIAANTLVFSLVDAVLLRELPYPDPDSLVMLWDRIASRPTSDVPITPRHYEAWQQRNDLFALTGAFETYPGTVRWEQGTERTMGMYVSPGLLSTLGAQPALGRLLTPEDHAEGAPPVAVLSHPTWQSRFGGSPDAIGRDLVINGSAVSIVGVMHADFWFFDPYMFARSSGDRTTAETTLWTALGHRRFPSDDFKDYPALRLLARLRPGVDLATANGAVATQRAAMAADEGRDGVTAELVPLRRQMIAPFEYDLRLLFGAVGMLLLVACANIASLQLARTGARRQELEVRRALGAGSWAIARVILSESALLGLAGGIGGLVLAAPLLGAVVAMTPRELPLVHRAAIDLRVAAATLSAALACGVLAGLAMAARARGGRDGALAGRGGRTVTRTRQPFQFAMAAAQVALSLALLVGAGAVGAAFVGLMTAETGFDSAHVMTFETAARDIDVGDGPRTDAYLQRLLERLRELPGVEAAAAGTRTPLSIWAPRQKGIRPQGAAADTDPIPMDYRGVTLDYFRTLGIERLAGRAFTAGDMNGDHRVAILNETAVRHLFPDRAAIGSRLEVIESSVRVAEVVGAVTDSLHRRPGERPRPVVYLPVEVADLYRLEIALRTTGDPIELVADVRREAARLSPANPVGTFERLDDLLRRSIARQEFFALLLGVFGMLSLLFAVAGLYGLVASAARDRLPEMGLRKAFGASAGSIRWLMLRHGLRPVVVGILVGAPAGIGLERLLAATISEVVAGNTARFALVVAAFATVAIAAALAPARRAASVDPTTALHDA